MVVARSGITGFLSWSAQLQRQESGVLKLRPVFGHGCRRHDQLGRLRDLRTNRPQNTLGQLTGCRTVGLQRTPDRPDMLNRT